MARKVSLEQLQTKQAQAQARLAREQHAVARLKKQMAQAEEAARRNRCIALGEVVEAVYGAITPDALHAVLRSLAPGSWPDQTEACTAQKARVFAEGSAPQHPHASPVLKKDMRDTQFPQGETVTPGRQGGGH